LLTGAAPFAERPNTAEKIQAHRSQPVLPVNLARPETPAELAALVERLLCKDPARRPASAAEVANRLAAWERGSRLEALVEAARGGRGEQPDLLDPGTQEGRSATPAMKGEPPANSTPGPTRRRSLARWVACLAGVVLLAAVGWRFLGDKQAGPDASPAAAQPAPDEWFALLDRPPTPLLVIDPRGDRVVQFDPGKRRFSCTSPGAALWKLYQAGQARYRLRVNIRQHPWTGGVGVFFGHRRAVENGKPASRYQLLEVRRQPANAKRGPKFWLYRSSIAQTVAPNSLGSDVRSIGAASIDSPQGDQLLELWVSPKGLFRLRWSGRDLPALTTLQANAAFNRDDYLGDLGLYLWSASGVFQNAELMLHEEKTP
jgi:hypothetical protein